MVNDYFVTINKKQKNIYSIIKTLYKLFPKQALFFDKSVNDGDLKYLIKFGFIEKISNDAFRTIDMQKIGEVHSFKLTEFGLRYFNEITLRSTNRWLLVLTIILVIIGVIQLIGVYR